MNYIAYLAHIGLMSAYNYSQNYTIEFTDFIAVSEILLHFPMLQSVLSGLLLCWLCDDQLRHRLCWHSHH